MLDDFNKAPAVHTKPVDYIDALCVSEIDHFLYNFFSSIIENAFDIRGPVMSNKQSENIKGVIPRFFLKVKNVFVILEGLIIDRHIRPVLRRNRLVFNVIYPYSHCDSMIKLRLSQFDSLQQPLLYLLKLFIYYLSFFDNVVIFYSTLFLPGLLKKYNTS